MPGPVAANCARDRSLRGKRVLVVGASGFIGSHVADRLVDQGAQVIGVSRGSPLARDAARELTWESCDATDPAAVDGIFVRHAPDVVYHLTSDSRNMRDVEVVRPSLMNDVVAAVNVLVAAAHNGCERLIMAASLDEPSGDAEVATPVSPYAAAKYATGCYARLFAEAFKLPVVLLRPMMGYGPRQNRNKLVPHTILSLLDEQPVAIHSPHRAANWVFIDDIVDAFVLAATAPDGAIGKTYDIGSPQMITNGDLVLLIAQEIGREDLVQLAVGDSRTAEVIRQPDTERTADEFGWTASTQLHTGLRRTISWFERHR
jgi:UDP-glucose 4-epimerase